MKRLTIRTAGLVSPVGFTGPASYAALRAGVSGVREQNLWHSASGTYLKGARARLPQWWTGLEKLADLVAPAIHECLVAARPAQAEQIPILICVAGSTRSHRLWDLNSRLLEEIEHRLELKHHSKSQVIPRGQAGGVVALRTAQELLRVWRAPYCIIAGVDSLLRQDVIEAYLVQRRVLAPDNSNGFIPGEAGSAVLVSWEDEFSHPRDALRVLGLGFGHEPSPPGSDLPLRAEGLTQAIGQALSESTVTMDDVAWRITDLNGEHDKFKEAAFAMARFPRKPNPRLFESWHPIEYVGEIGAAIVPCLIGWALHAGRKDYAPGSIALCHCGSDEGERAAIIVRFDPERGDT